MLTIIVSLVIVPVLVLIFYVGYYRKGGPKMAFGNDDDHGHGHGHDDSGDQKLNRILMELHEVRVEVSRLSHTSKADPRVDTILAKINSVGYELSQIKKEIDIMSQQMDALIVQVQANHDIEESAVVLIKGIADQLAAAGVDQTKLSELQASLKSSADALSAAVVANTTPATEPPVTPPVTP